MKHTVSYILLAALLLSGSAAFAEGNEVEAGASATVSASSTMPRRPLPAIRTTLQKIGDKIEMKKEERKDDRPASTTKPEANDQDKGESRGNVQENAGKRLDKMVERFTATVDRLENIMARLQSRVVKIKSTGGNTVAAEKSIADAKLHLDTAKQNIADLKAGVAVAITASTTASTTPKTNPMAQLSQLSKKAEKELQAAQKSLSKAVGGLLGKRESEEHATTTVQVQTSSTVSQ